VRLRGAGLVIVLLAAGLPQGNAGQAEFQGTTALLGTGPGHLVLHLNSPATIVAAVGASEGPGAFGLLLDGPEFPILYFWNPERPREFGTVDLAAGTYYAYLLVDGFYPTSVTLSLSGQGGSVAYPMEPWSGAIHHLQNPLDVAAPAVFAPAAVVGSRVHLARQGAILGVEYDEVFGAGAFVSHSWHRVKDSRLRAECTPAIGILLGGVIGWEAVYGSWFSVTSGDHMFSIDHAVVGGGLQVYHDAYVVSLELDREDPQANRPIAFWQTLWQTAPLDQLPEVAQDRVESTVCSVG
jgi:hypothetical protein